MATNLFEIALQADDLLYAALMDKESEDPGPILPDVSDRLRATTDWLEVVPDMTGITVKFDNLVLTQQHARQLLTDQLDDMRFVVSKSTAKTLEIPVCYDAAFGPDLPLLEQELGLSQDEIVKRHLAEMYRIQMIGFLPGFAYCGVLDESLAAPRLTTPRARVEAGSVAITGRQTGIYSLPSPGGWCLIGRTPVKLFDAERDEPFLLRPGMEISFRRIGKAEFDALYREYHP